MTVIPRPLRNTRVRIAYAARGPLKPQIKMIRSPIQQSKPCPVCGVALLARRTKPSHLEPDYFECLSCGAVVKYSESTTPQPKTTDEEKT
jgi:predicted RNA-binding Zn-ribbon protein involved in translation (DUF1610 family)